MRVLFCLLSLAAAFFSHPANAQEAAFQSWLDHFAVEAEKAGVSPATIQRVWPEIHFDESVIELDRKQPEGQITLARYLRGAMPRARVRKGRELLSDYDSSLRQISARYGVPPAVIVALWGIESSFGSHMGESDVLSSLATLAFEGRRAALFQGELIEALKVLEEEGLPPSALKGSWAGAMGQSQFMPSTYRRYAVDWDGDGQRDIWNSETDSLASIASYLAAEGWRAGESWGREVALSRPLSPDQMGLAVQRNLAVWSRFGVRSLGGRPLPDKALSASLIQSDGAGGRAFLVYDNFRAIMRWNRSTYFATAVGLLAEELENGK